MNHKVFPSGWKTGIIPNLKWALGTVTSILLRSHSFSDFGLFPHMFALINAPAEYLKSLFYRSLGFLFPCSVFQAGGSLGHHRPLTLLNLDSSRLSWSEIHLDWKLMKAVAGAVVKSPPPLYPHAHRLIVLHSVMFSILNCCLYILHVFFGLFQVEDFGGVWGPHIHAFDRL